jgi:phosphocarrier protein
MVTGMATVGNRVGLHLSAATAVVETSMKFKSRITVARSSGKDGKKRNALSVLDLLMLEAVPGTLLSIEVDGEDEREALAALLDLFKNNFGEK